MEDLMKGWQERRAGLISIPQLDINLKFQWKLSCLSLCLDLSLGEETD
jgi:hypothetical protein